MKRLTRPVWPKRVWQALLGREGPGFEATFELAHVGIAHVAPDGRWLRVNPRLCEIVGYPREDLLTRTFQDITHPDDLDADLDLVHGMLKREIESYSLEKRYLRQDGEQVWVRLSVALVWKMDDTPDYFISVVEDITARKADEAALAASRARYRELEKIVENLAGARELDTLMAIVAHSLRGLTGADGVAVVLRDGDRCHYAEEDAIGPLWKGQRFPMEACISGWSMLRHEALAVEDIYADARIPQEAYRPTFVKSLSMVPIGRDDPLGAVGCYWATHHRASPEELDVQQAVADALAVALDNLRLYREVSQARDTAETARTALSAALEEQGRARLAALSLMEDALAARAKAEAATEALSASEQRFHQIFDNMSSGVAVYRPSDDGEDFIFADFNRAAGRIDQLQRADVIGRRLTEVFPGARDIGLLDVLRRVAQTGQPESCPLAFYRDARIAGWRENYVYRLPGGELVAIYDDVTARKLAEEALADSEHRFHDIVDASADWIWEVDAEGRYTYVSDSVYALLGYKPAELLGKTPFDLMPEDEADRVRAHFAGIAERQASFRDLDNTNLHRDGTVRYIMTNGTPMLDAGGKFTGYRGLDRDVTEQKQAELALRESEERFRALFDNASVSIMVHDADTGAILDANRRAIESYHYEDLESLRAANFWLDPPYSFDDAVALIRKAAKEGAQRYEWKTSDRDGNLFWEDVLLSPMTLNGVERVIAITVDITARKQAEDDLRQRTEELERFNRAMVGRELAMIDLKREINARACAAGEAPPYDTDFAEDDGDAA